MMVNVVDLSLSLNANVIANVNVEKGDHSLVHQLVNGTKLNGSN